MYIVYSIITIHIVKIRNVYFKFIFMTKDKKESSDKNPFQDKAKRCQFTMPEEDNELIDKLVLRYQKLAAAEATEVIKVNRSMIIRAGIQALDKYRERSFKKAVNDVEKLQEGRRSENKK